MHSNVTHSAALQRHASVSKQFLCFRLGGLEYGLDFRKVQELRVLESMERCAPEDGASAGVVLAPGVIMPLVDMRVAFGWRRLPANALTDVIILKLSSCIVGIVVDGVSDVVCLSADQIKPVPGVARGIDVDYLIGLGQLGARRLVLVDIDKLMAIRKAEEHGKQHAGGARQAA